MEGRRISGTMDEAALESTLGGDGSHPGLCSPFKITSTCDGTATNKRRRTAIAEQCARWHLLRRLRRAGHGMSTDLNPAYELICAVGVETQGKQGRLQVIPGEPRVVEQQPTGDILGRVGSMGGFHTAPLASNEANFYALFRFPCSQPKIAVGFRGLIA